MTMHSQPVTPQKKSLPLVSARPAPDADIDVEAELRAFEEAERERLGLKADRKQWADGMLDLSMKKSERANVTSLDLVEVNPVLDDRNLTGILAVELAQSLLGKRIF